MGENGDEIGKSETGALWILFMKSDNTVLRKQKISATFHCCLSLVGHNVNQVVTGKVVGFIISNRNFCLFS